MVALEGSDAGEFSSGDETVDVVGSLVGVDDLCVGDGLDAVVVSDDAVAAEHFSSEPGHVSTGGTCPGLDAGGDSDGGLL